MQIKDISDDEFLEAVDTARILRGPNPLSADNVLMTATMWDVQAVLSGYPEHVGLDDKMGTTYEFYLPRNLVRAKARNLIRKGKIDGCYCGCRGDLTVIVELPADRSLRLKREGETTALGVWENLAREWRVRDEIIQDLKSQIKVVESDWKWGETDTRAERIKPLQEELDKWSTYQIVIKDEDGATKT
jgi:hypothetical protein